jgi:hypothetical protein
MKTSILRIATVLALAAGGAIVSAQGPGGVILPGAPKLAFGASVTPAYDGWFDNADGTHSYLVGYYSRNWTEEVDIPIGPNNHFEPGPVDRGQPTHFLPNRNFGMFLITMPKEWGPTDRIWWVLTLNGITTRVPFHRSPDFNLTPLKGSEEASNGTYDEPPTLRFAQGGPAIKGPMANPTNAISKTAKVNVPMPLQLFVEDDAHYTNGTNAAPTRTPTLVSAVVEKYRGPGGLWADGFNYFTTTKGGKILEPYAGHAEGEITFYAAGDYIVHVTINDTTGKGGGASGCCWTTAMIKVNVTP